MNFSEINKTARHKLETIQDYKEMVDDCLQIIKLAQQKIDSLQHENEQLKDDLREARKSICMEGGYE